jgi:putative DNA primase/helicase
MFLEENSLTADPVKWKLLKEIFATYRSFCTENGFHALNKTNFNKRLTAFGVQVDRKNIGMVVFLSSPNDL